MYKLDSKGTIVFIQRFKVPLHVRSTHVHQDAKHLCMKIVTNLILHWQSLPHWLLAHLGSGVVSSELWHYTRFQPPSRSFETWLCWLDQSHCLSLYRFPLYRQMKIVHLQDPLAMLHICVLVIEDSLHQPCFPLSLHGYSYGSYQQVAYQDLSVLLLLYVEYRYGVHTQLQ